MVEPDLVAIAARPAGAATTPSATATIGVP